MMVIFNGRNSGQHQDTGVRSMDYVVHTVNVAQTILTSLSVRVCQDMNPRIKRIGISEMVLRGVRKQMGLPMCGNGEGFVNVGPLKVPDTSDAVWVGMSMSSAECKQACLKNCACTAYVSLDINGTGTSCLAYYGILMDSSVNTDEGWDLNVRVDATELGIFYFFFLAFS